MSDTRVVLVTSEGVCAKLVRVVSGEEQRHVLSIRY